MDYKTITFEMVANPRRREEKTIGVLTLNQPERLNAITPLMRLELDTIFSVLRYHPDMRVLIITGAGRGFSSGGDLKTEATTLGIPIEEEEPTGLTGPYKEMMEYWFNDIRHFYIQRLMRRLEDMPQITIAAINGWAAGAGMEMIAMCDIRVASDQAKIAEVAVAAGFFPESGGTRTLPKLIGKGRALELILTGRPVNSEEALRIGLVDRVVPHAKLMEQTLDLAGEIACKPYLSILRSKELVKMYWMSEASDERWAKELQSVNDIVRTKDCQEGIRAFLEKRPPNYRGPRVP